ANAAGALQPGRQPRAVLRRRERLAVRTDGPAASTDRRLRRRPCRPRAGTAARQPAVPRALDRLARCRVPRAPA
nr:hypothetical protein [Tanacetum cinerariifolium]